MSKGGSSETTDSTTRISDELRGSAVGALQDAENLYNLGTEGIYKGSRLAEEDPLLRQAQEDRLAQFGEGGRLSGLIDSGLSNFQNYLNAGDLANNPVFQQQMENILGEASTKFSRGSVPIFQKASAAGQYGGSEGGEALALLGGEIDRSTQNALTQYALGQQQLGLQAQGMLPQVLRTGMMGEDVAEAVGKQRSLRDQAELMDEIQMYEADRNAQLRNLSEFYNFLQSSPLVAEANQKSTVTQQTESDPFSALLGAGLTIAGMPVAGGGSLGGNFVSGLFGSGGGGGIGGDLGFDPSGMSSPF